MIKLLYPWGRSGDKGGAGGRRTAVPSTGPLCHLCTELLRLSSNLFTPDRARLQLHLERDL